SRHEIAVFARVAPQRIQRRTARGRIARGAKGAQTLDLLSLDRRIDREDPRGGCLLFAERVDADDDASSLLDLTLCRVGGVLDLPLEEALLDRSNRPSELVHLRNEG